MASQPPEPRMEPRDLGLGKHESRLQAKLHAVHGPTLCGWDCSEQTDTATVYGIYVRAWPYCAVTYTCTDILQVTPRTPPIGRLQRSLVFTVRITATAYVDRIRYRIPVAVSVCLFESALPHLSSTRHARTCTSSRSTGQRQTRSTRHSSARGRCTWTWRARPHRSCGRRAPAVEGTPCSGRRCCRR